jgi:hypothetical protein
MRANQIWLIAFVSLALPQLVACDGDVNPYQSSYFSTHFNKLREMSDDVTQWKQDEPSALEGVEMAKRGQGCGPDPSSMYSCTQALAQWYGVLAAIASEKGNEQQALANLDQSIHFADLRQAADSKSASYGFSRSIFQSYQAHPEKNPEVLRSRFEYMKNKLPPQLQERALVDGYYFFDEPKFIDVTLRLVRTEPQHQRRYSSLAALLAKHNRPEVVEVETIRVTVLRTQGPTIRYFRASAADMRGWQAAYLAAGLQGLANTVGEAAQQVEARDRRQQAYDERMRQILRESDAEENDSAPVSLPVPVYYPRPSTGTSTTMPSYGSSTSTGTTPSPKRPTRSEAVPFHK